MAKGKTTEQKMVEEAEVVEPVQAEEPELANTVRELIEAQFGGEDQEPTEGTERWDPIVREMVIEADKLETEYRSILQKKEDNRTLLRAFAGMGKVPAEIPEFYYPPRKRLTKAEREAAKATATENGEASTESSE